MEITDIHKCCRVCTNRNVQMISIFEYYKYSDHNLPIFEVITRCASVQIQKLDGLSEQICKECMEQLRQAFSFKLLCEDSDYKFRHNMVKGHSFDSQNASSNELQTKILQSEVNEELQGMSSVTKPEIKTEFIRIEETKIQYGVLETQLPDDKSRELSPEEIDFSKDNCLMCEFCRQTFSEESLLNNHEKTHTKDHNKFEINHDPTLITHPPNFSGRFYKDENSDNKPLTTDAEKRSHKCETCGESFKDKGKLTIHNRIHTGEKPYKCNICYKNFAYPSAFLYHEKIHAGGKGKCVTCSKDFTNLCALICDTCKEARKAKKCES